MSSSPAEGTGSPSIPCSDAAVAQPIPPRCGWQYASDLPSSAGPLRVDAGLEQRSQRRDRSPHRGVLGCCSKGRAHVFRAVRRGRPLSKTAQRGWPRSRTAWGERLTARQSPERTGGLKAGLIGDSGEAAGGPGQRPKLGAPWKPRATADDRHAVTPDLKHRDGPLRRTRRKQPRHPAAFQAAEGLSGRSRAGWLGLMARSGQASPAPHSLPAGSVRDASTNTSAGQVTASKAQIHTRKEGPRGTSSVAQNHRHRRDLRLAGGGAPAHLVGSALFGLILVAEQPEGVGHGQVGLGWTEGIGARGREGPRRHRASRSSAALRTENEDPRRRAVKSALSLGCRDSTRSEPGRCLALCNALPLLGIPIS